ncbi:TA system VapC family ribonuclease toxin [Actinomycetota bacterium]
MSCLLDANVLMALTVAEHEHHDRAGRWLADVDAFAVSPIVQGALVRFLLRMGVDAATAQTLLAAVMAHPRCDFWPDDVCLTEADLSGVRGHRQLTDVYLAALAASHDARLATFDQALAALRPDSTLLVP